jgi:FkbM family methyltransferase
MPTLRRHLAKLIEFVSGNLVIAPNELHLMHEREHLRQFFAHFAVDCVFDVGAHSGQYATMLRDNVGFQGPIISYEPIPEMVERLRVLSANDPNWHIEALALDREAGPAVFHLMAESQFSSLHTPSANQPETFQTNNSVVRDVQVMRTTVADEFGKWQRKLGFMRPFLKMDTQGNDCAVVAGAGNVIRTFVGLQSELAIRKLYAESMDFAEAIAVYRECGFELSALVPNNAGHFPTLVEIDCVMFNPSSRISHRFRPRETR